MEGLEGRIGFEKKRERGVDEERPGGEGGRRRGEERKTGKGGRKDLRVMSWSKREGFEKSQNIR